MEELNYEDWTICPNCGKEHCGDYAVCSVCRNEEQNLVEEYGE